MKKVLIFSLLLSFNLSAKDIQLKDLSISDELNYQFASSSKMVDRLHFTGATRLWAYAASAFLAGTALTGKHGDVSGAHKILSYFAVSAYTAATYAYSLEAKKPQSISRKWADRLQYIHLPAVLAIPILGVIAERQIEKGEAISGAGKLHSKVAGLGLFTYLASTALLTYEF